MQETYLRLIGTYESDVQVGNKWVHCFLFLLETRDGQRFMCPTYTENIYIKTTRKVLRRLSPILYAPDDPKKVLKDEQTVEMTELSHHEMLPEDTQKH